MRWGTRTWLSGTPVGYQSRLAESKRPDGSYKPHNERPIEKDADVYAGGRTLVSARSRVTWTDCRLLILLLLSVATPGVDGGPEGKTEPAALSLEVKIEAPEYALGDTVHLEYVLTNRSQRPVKGCVTGWNTYTFQFPRDWFRQFSAPVDGVAEARMFLIPSGMRLGWQTEVKIPENAGFGSATLVGELESDDGGCSYGWYGKIKSAPAPFQIVERDPKRPRQIGPKSDRSGR